MNTIVIAPVFPEIFLFCMLAVMMLADLATRGQRAYLVHWLSMLTLVALAAWCGKEATLGTTVYAVNGMYVADPMANILKAFSALAVAVTLIYSRDYAASREMARGELYALTLFALLGQFVMISANSLLVIYMGIELLSLSLYALVALRRDSHKATEAAMKYFVLGALASGFLLYGMSMIYGATGTLELPEIAQKVSGQATTDRLVLVFGVVFLVAGLAFKLGAVPFHMWVPDIYEGSPTAATLVIGGAPKLAAFAIVLRLLVEGLFSAAADWQPMLAVLAIASLAIGNVIAIAQTNVKRMLAYSTISHMGFMLLGFMSGVVPGAPAAASNMAADAYSASMFYVVTYVLTTLASFGMLMLLSRAGVDCETLDDLKGLNQRSPWYAVLMLLVMFSLAGVPPTVGFYAKLSVLQSAVAAGHMGIAIFAVMMSLVGAFYYLRIVKLMYFDAPIDTAPIQACGDVRAVLSINGALVLLLGLMPGPLMALCSDAVRRALAG